MAKLFQEDHFVPAWLAATRYLDTQPHRMARNIVLEIARPLEITPTDLQVFDMVDVALRAHADSSVRTVAGTIFPWALYRRFGRPGLYERYEKIIARGKPSGTWGTYAHRLISWPTADGKGTFRPLDEAIKKLDRAAHGGHPYQSAYEMGVIAPAIDLDPNMPDVGAELPTFDASCDAKKIGNMPCLSHLSFKMTNRETVDLTAIYRSHHYAARTLGNLLGLSQVLAFVATEAKLKVGVLTCISTHAELDLGSWGNAASSRALMTSLGALEWTQNKAA
jgi:hypothetical protein